MTDVREFALPDLGEGLTEGEILRWLVKVGDTITLNQPIVEVETAKAAVEIPAKWAGQVTAIFHGEGETIEVGTPIIAIETRPGDVPRTRSTADSTLAAIEVVGDAPVEPGLIGGPAPGGRTAVLVGYGPRSVSAKRRARTSPTTGPGGDNGHVSKGRIDDTPSAVPGVAVPGAPRPGPAGALAKPPVRKLAKELGVDLNTLTGSGPNGSVSRADVVAATSAPPTAVGLREQRIPIRGIRKLTAENMVASAFTAPHVTEFLTVDVTRTMRALDRLRAMSDWRDVRISPLLVVAKAALVALRRHPLVNATWAGDEIIVKDYVNLGIAAATDRGLIVPNIKDAGRLPFRDLAEALSALVTTAKAGRTPPADMAGGTFTITNVGVFGVDTGTPILPPGEAAILAVGTVRETPWVHKHKIKIRQVATLALSFDHRLIDGELGSRFLRDVGAFLTDPEAALLAWC